MERKIDNKMKTKMGKETGKSKLSGEKLASSKHEKSKKGNHLNK